MPTIRTLERRSDDGGRESRSFALQIKSIGEDGAIEGYGSVFGVRDMHDDIVAAGAFSASLAAHAAAGTMPAMLWQHDDAEPVGVWDSMIEDANGLLIKGRLCLETEAGRSAYALLKMRALNGLSIGFIAKQWAYDRETDIRTVTEVDLWEVSLVTFGSNPKAKVTSVKAAEVTGLTTIRQAEKALRDAGFSDSAAKVFVAYVKRIALDERDAHGACVAMKAADRLLSSLTS